MTNAPPSVKYKVVDYLYYRDYVRREPGVEPRNPSGTLRQDWRGTSELDVRRAEHTNWALLPRGNFTGEELPEDVTASSAKWDVCLPHDCATDIHVTFRIQGKFPQSHEGTFQVQKTIRSSRTFLLHPRDAGYVERMEWHLLDGDVSSPSTKDVLSRAFVYVGDKNRCGEASYGIHPDTGRLVSWQDFKATAQAR